MSLSIISSIKETFSKKRFNSENMMPSLQPSSEKNVLEDLGCSMEEGELPQFSIRLGGGPQWWF